MICVSEYGTFEDFSASAFGQMKNVALPASFSEENTDTAIRTATKSAKVDEKDYAIQSKELMKLSDGTLALRIAAEVTKDNTNQLIEFIVKLGK